MSNTDSLGTPIVAGPGQIASQQDSPRFRGMLRARPAFAIGVTIVAIVLIMALIPDQLAPYPPDRAEPGQVLTPPSQVHWFGTDGNGFDVFSRTIWAARVDLAIAIVSTGVSMVIGTLSGAWAGYQFGRRGWQAKASGVLLRSLDAAQAVPVFVLALALVAALGRDVVNVIYALILVETPIFLRITRSAVLRTRQEPFVDAARCAGSSEMRLVLRHILPNAFAPALTNASVVAGSAILLTAGLSFVGAGVPAPTAEWGYMVAVGAPHLFIGKWWPALFPGLCIGVVVLGFSLLGDGMRDLLDAHDRH